MKLTGITSMAIAALLLAAQPSLAGPDKNESGKGQGKAEKHAGKHAKKGKGHKEAAFSHGGPPPWAPAHGYRGGGDSGTSSSGQAGSTVVVAAAGPYNPEFEAKVQADNARISTDIGIAKGTCNRDKIGTVLGAVAGGVIANRTASDENKTVATIAGVVVGGIVGHTIGQTMDNRDVQCTGQALERVADNQTIAWRNSTNGQEYQVTPQRTFTHTNGLFCREYVARTAGSTRSESSNTACRNPDGTWSMLR